MKAYIEFIGNEVRQPQKGERFEDKNGSIVVACYDHEEIRRMVTRHEIEIPDDATILHCWPGDVRSSEILHFPIPRPKKKVKKTVYLHVQKERGKMVYDVQTGTPILFGDDAVYPVEIEVEE